MRITERDLSATVARINKITGSPMEITEPNNFHLDHAYGAVRLERNAAFGGCIDALESGYRTRRELYELMHAFIRGYNLAKGY